MYYLKYFCIFQSENRTKNIEPFKAETEYFKMEKEQIYRQTTSQIKSLIDGVDNKVGALANVAAALKETFSYYFWVGFYIVKGEVLELGPFQGPVACYTIKKGKGVCGTAWEERRTIVVPDVEKFPGHIACSSKSRSEIVVPVFKGSDVAAVIDVDSANLNAFDDKDKEGLEKIAEIIRNLPSTRQWCACQC